MFFYDGKFHPEDVTEDTGLFHSADRQALMPSPEKSSLNKLRIRSGRWRSSMCQALTLEPGKPDDSRKMAWA